MYVQCNVYTPTKNIFLIFTARQYRCYRIQDDDDNNDNERATYVVLELMEKFKSAETEPHEVCMIMLLIHSSIFDKRKKTPKFISYLSPTVELLVYTLKKAFKVHQ